MAGMSALLMLWPSLRAGRGAGTQGGGDAATGLLSATCYFSYPLS